MLLAGALALFASLLMPSALLAQPDPGEPPEEPVESTQPADGEAPKGGPASTQQDGEGEPAEAEVEAEAVPEPRATAAQSTTVSIGDFFFAPASITVDVGETVTWVNGGAVAEGHTATARDGSFDTGVLRTGERGAQTFTRAGTFAYVCSLHPAQMRGTVTVRGAAEPDARDPGGGPGAPAEPDAGPAGVPDADEAPGADEAPREAGAAELAEGGWEVLAPLLLGLALLGLGIALRRQARIG